MNNKMNNDLLSSDKMTEIIKFVESLKKHSEKKLISLSEIIFYDDFFSYLSEHTIDEMFLNFKILSDFATEKTHLAIKTNDNKYLVISDSFQLLLLRDSWIALKSKNERLQKKELKINCRVLCPNKNEIVEKLIKNKSNLNDVKFSISDLIIYFIIRNSLEKKYKTSLLLEFFSNSKVYDALKKFLPKINLTVRSFFKLIGSSYTKFRAYIKEKTCKDKEVDTFSTEKVSIEEPIEKYALHLKEADGKVIKIEIFCFNNKIRIINNGEDKTIELPINSTDSLNLDQDYFYINFTNLTNKFYLISKNIKKFVILYKLNGAYYKLTFSDFKDHKLEKIDQNKAHNFQEHDNYVIYKTKEKEFRYNAYKVFVFPSPYVDKNKLREDLISSGMNLENVS